MKRTLFGLVIALVLADVASGTIVGQLIRVQSPYPEPSYEAEGNLRAERFYYDGVRRIQEVFIDPAASMGEMMAGGEGAGMQAAAEAHAANSEEELDESATPAELEQLGLTEGTTPSTYTYLSREYVWGPGDWGVDEIVAQYDEQRRVTFPLQDASGDVIALADMGGGGGPGNSARIVTEIVYDAYGRVLDRADLAGTTPADVRMGHKGLFFDRLDGGVVDPYSYADTRRLEAGAGLIGFNRNRTLHTVWGRFLQRDPNSTGVVVQEGMALHGKVMRGGVQGFDLDRHYTDGTNVYAYLGGSPWNHFDPAGTEMMLEMMGSMGVRGMLAGALIGGIYGGVQGYHDGDIARGIARGVVVGGVAGGVGGMGFAVSQSAFAASAAGLWASLMSGGTAGGVAGYAGGLAGSTQYQIIDGQAVDWRVAFADAATSSAWGAALGGFGSSISWMIRTPSLTVTFGHGARHLKGTGLSSDMVETAIMRDINRMAANSPQLPGRFTGTVQVGGGTNIEYRAFTRSGNNVHVGTYYPPKN